MKYGIAILSLLLGTSCQALEGVNPVIGDWGYADDAFGCFRITQEHFFSGDCGPEGIEQTKVAYSVHSVSTPYYVLQTDDQHIVLKLGRSGWGMEVSKCASLTEVEKALAGESGGHGGWARAGQRNYWEQSISDNLPAYHVLDDVPVFAPKGRRLPDLDGLEAALEEYYQALNDADSAVYCKYHEDYCSRVGLERAEQSLQNLLQSRLKHHIKAVRPQRVIDRVEIEGGVIVDVPHVGSDNWIYREGKWEFGGTI